MSLLADLLSIPPFRDDETDPEKQLRFVAMVRKGLLTPSEAARAAKVERMTIHRWLNATKVNDSSEAEGLRRLVDRDP